MLAAIAFAWSMIVIFLKRERLITLPVLSLLTLTVFGIPGSYLALAERDWWLRDVRYDTLRQAYVIYCVIAIVAATVVLVLMKPRVERPVDRTGGVESANVWVLSGAALLIGLITALVMFPGSPLQSLLLDRNADALILAELRGGVSSQIADNRLLAYHRNLVVGYILPFICVYLFVVARDLPRARLHAWVSLAVVMFCVSQELAKAPIVYAALTPLAVRMYFERVPVRLLALYGVVGAGLLIALYVFVMGAAGEEVALQIRDRITIAQYAGFPLALEVFPDVHPHIRIANAVGLLSAITGNESLFFSRIVMEYANPEGVAAGTAGFMSTVAYAEGYAIGGMVGLAATAAIAMLFLGAVHQFERVHDVRVQALYIVLCMKLPRFVMDSFTSLVWNYGVATLVVVIVSWMFLDQHLAPRRNYPPVDAVVGGSGRSHR